MSKRLGGITGLFFPLTDRHTSAHMKHTYNRQSVPYTAVVESYVFVLNRSFFFLSSIGSVPQTKTYYCRTKFAGFVLECIFNFWLLFFMKK